MRIPVSTRSLLCAYQCQPGLFCAYARSLQHLGLPRYCAGALNRRDLIYGMSLLHPRLLCTSQHLNRFRICRIAAMSLLCTLNDGVACSVGGAGSVYVCVHVLKPATRLPNAGSVCPAHELCKLISLSKTKSMYAMCAGSR